MVSICRCFCAALLGERKKGREDLGQCCCVYDSQMEATLRCSVLQSGPAILHCVLQNGTHTGSNPQIPSYVQSFFPAKYPSYSVSGPERIQFITSFYSLASPAKYLAISYLSPSIQVIVCLRWIHFGQKESSLKKKKI